MELNIVSPPSAAVGRPIALRPRHSGGFTLIEVLIAATVLAIAALVAFPTMLSFVALSDAARQKNVATHDLSTAMEDVMSAPFNQVTTTYVPGQPIPKFEKLHLTNERIVVAYADPAADPLVVTLTATWKDSHGRPMTGVLRCARTR
jgi:prepilin-type N-terminal cleavage/methylation domain-containing protein